ncbi:MAG: 3'-5' exonuclease [Gammaproteobacteria bacterium]|nr:3'-5' exonuclease [Gammaproteobacteria bacterium]
MQELLVICDLEATCWEDGQTPAIDDMEVIEIGCVLCNIGGDAVDEFSTFVRPTKNPSLSPFCRQLTNISQKDVDLAPLFEDAMQLLDEWCASRNAFWSSWGNFDRKLLMNQEQRTQSSSLFTKLAHVNLKKAWRRTNKIRSHTGLQNALNFHGICFEGTPHRAIFDAKNTARLLPFIQKSEFALQLGLI